MMRHKKTVQANLGRSFFECVSVYFKDLRKVYPLNLYNQIYFIKSERGWFSNSF